MLGNNFMLNFQHISIIISIIPSITSPLALLHTCTNRQLF